MKLLFEIEQYEDMKDLPFSLDIFFDNRINIFFIENGRKNLLLSSTFHNGILVEIGEALINLSDDIMDEYVIETYENALKYTFIKQHNQLTLECLSENDSSVDKILTCGFEDFMKAYVNEYLKYTKYLLAQDENAFHNDIFKMMKEQINILNNISSKIV